MNAIESADWCEDHGSLVICGTRMKEYSRHSEGVKWCFTCRRRTGFFRVVMAPDGPSWYGPTIHIECGACGTIDGDCFPGSCREWED